MKLTPIAAAFVSGCTLLTATALIPTSALAGYSCKENFFGEYECSGTMNGQRINTTSKTNFFGERETTGTIGGQRIRQTCKENFFGEYECN